MIKQSIRTLIKQGGALTITLPKEWVDNHGLKKGDQVKTVYRRTGELIIRVVKDDPII
jgi:antitoxin component of MazEF toxin-antitoxin module